MAILELYRRFCREEYNGNFDKMVEEKDGIIFDDERIKRAFNFGNGTAEDMKKHMRNNNMYCRYYDMESHTYIN